jgi:hypothetical protein
MKLPVKRKIFQTQIQRTRFTLVETCLTILFSSIPIILLRNVFIIYSERDVSMRKSIKIYTSKDITRFD